MSMSRGPALKRIGLAVVAVMALLTATVVSLYRTRFLNLEQQHAFDLDTGLWAVALSPDERFLAVAPAGLSVVYILDAQSGDRLKSLDADVYSLAFSPNSQILAGDGPVALFFLHMDDALKTTGSSVTPPKYRHQQNPAPGAPAAFYPDGKTLVMRDSEERREIQPGNPAGTSLLLVSSSKVGRCCNHGAEIEKIVISPKGTLLATAGSRAAPEAETGIAKVKVWSWASQALRYTYASQSGRIEGIAFSPDEELIAISDANGIKVLRAENGAVVSTLSGAGTGGPIAFLPDGRNLANVAGGRIRLWNAWSGELRGSLDTEIADGGATLEWRGGVLLCASEQRVEIWHPTSLIPGFVTSAVEGLRAWNPARLFSRSTVDDSTPTGVVQSWRDAVAHEDLAVYDRVWSRRMHRVFEELAAKERLPIEQLYRRQMVNMAHDVAKYPAPCCEEVKGGTATVKWGDLSIDVVLEEQRWKIDGMPHSWR